MSSMGLQRSPSNNNGFAHIVANQPLSQPVRIVGRSPAISRLMEQMERSVTHLRGGAIEGERGTGKSLVAAELHTRGPASAGPLVTVHSSLFDPAKVPTGGMLMLERIDEMPANRQAILLNFLRCRDSFTFEPSLIPLQLVVSSPISLRALVAGGSLLPDLAYRLTAVRFYLPPLRERHEDIPILAQYFLDHFAKKYGKPIQGLGSGTLTRLFSHNWPGNIRELRCVLESAVLETEGQWIRPLDISLTPPASSRPTQGSTTSVGSQNDMTLDTAARNHVSAVLAHARGNKKRAAALLGISRSTLYRMLERE
jgi:DNA-binding NtrC family response regulator